jgi:TPR repeat protein
MLALITSNYPEAAMWYRRAAEQGDSLVQHSIDLLYDHGQACRGISSKPANGSTFPLRPRRPRPWKRARTRDAVTGKMTRGEIVRARLRALEWAPTRER